MTLVCDVEGCPYRTKSRFCGKRLVSIYSNGMCSQLIMKNGSPNANFGNYDDNLSAYVRQDADSEGELEQNSSAAAKTDEKETEKNKEKDN